jgi:gliding motility-associated-like protein
MKVSRADILRDGKKVLRLAALLCSLLLFSGQEAKATHIVGGHITYRCLGNNQYEIRLSLRRDCLLGAADAQFDDPASIGFFDATTDQPLTFVGFGGQLLIEFNEDDTLNQVLVSDCSIAGNPVCVHQTTYLDTIFLPFWQNGYKMVYQRCCRNGSVNNILNPITTGMTIITEMSGAAQAVCKSSPQIGAYPPIYICVNKPIDFIPNAFDIDGDSLGFSFATPFSGGDIVNNMPQPPNPPPYNLVNFRPPYSLANIMGGVPLVINPVTGQITGTPNTIGQFVITIVVTAYRDGVVLSETRVDFQYNVRDCRDVPVADFTAPALNCNDLTVPFTNLSQNSDRYLWVFDTGNPQSDSSTAVSPTYTYDEEGFYDVTLFVRDSDFICFDTIVKRVGVFTSIVNAEFSYGSISCTDSIVLNFTDLSSSSNPNYQIVGWEWLLTYGGNVLASTDQNPTFNLDVDDPTTAFVVLTVTDTNGCTDSEAKAFQIQEFDIAFNPDADSICHGESVHLLLNGNCDLDYTWSPPNGLDLTSPCDPIAFPGISADYYVTVTDGVCTLTDSTHVGVQQLPNLAFTYTTDCKNLEVDFLNESTNGILYFWEFGVTTSTTDTTSVEDPSFVYPEPGQYIVTLFSRDGCDVLLSLPVTVNAITEQLDDQTVNCFQDSINLNPDANLAYDYLWAPAELLNGLPTNPNPSTSVTTDTWFYVTITQATLPDCEIVDSILVIIPDDFTISAGGDITNCTFSDVGLNAVVTGNTNVVVTWTDMEGNVLGTGLELTVTPQITTCYVVTATDTLGCSRSDTVCVLKPDPAFSVLAGGDTTYCYVTTITLTATSAVQNLTYEWYNANGQLIGTEASIDVTPGSRACFHVIGTDSLGCQAADTICLTPSFISIIVSSEDEDFCIGDSATLTVTGPTNVSYEWFDANNQSIGTGQTIIVFTLVPACYHVTGTDSLGCQDTDTVCINPVSFNTSIGGDNNVCIGDPASICVTDNAGQDLTYIWDDPAGSTTVCIAVNPTVTTTYSVTVTNETLGCKDTLSHQVVVFSFNPAITITAIPDSVILTETSQLLVNQNPDFDYVWSASTGELVDPIFNPVVTPTGSTTYCVTVTDFNGCTGTACASVGVADPACDRTDIFLPNAFTPNNDGENDELCVRSNFISTMELHIYNRWGEEVFSSKDQSNCWNGTFNGTLLSPDVFGYYMTIGCPNGESYFEKGNVTLLH